MARVIVLVVLAACDRPKPVVFDGVPAGAYVACSWDYFHEDRGECTAAGKRYRCVRNETRDAVLVACSPWRLWK